MVSFEIAAAWNSKQGTCCSSHVSTWDGLSLWIARGFFYSDESMAILEREHKVCLYCCTVSSGSYAVLVLGAMVGSGIKLMLEACA